MLCGTVDLIPPIVYCLTTCDVPKDIGVVHLRHEAILKACVSSMLCESVACMSGDRM